MTNQESDAPAVPKLLFATVSGAIGVIATLTAEKYALLHHLESNMSKVIKGVGGLSHASYVFLLLLFSVLPSLHFYHGSNRR